VNEFLEKIIKLTDYPFSYSLLALIMLIATGSRFDVTQPDFIKNYLPFIVLIGLFGTLLAILDPAGNLIRFYLYREKIEGIKIFLSNIDHWLSMRLRLRPRTVDDQSRKYLFKYKKPRTWADYEDYVNRKHGYQTYKDERLYKTKINSTNWISYEIDKIVSIMYFSTIVLLTIIVIQDQSLYSSFINVISNIQNQSGESVFSKFYLDIRIYLLVILIVSIGLLTVAIIVKMLKLRERVEVIKVYFKVNDELDKYKKDEAEFNLLLERIKNFLFYINNRDWGMAEYFAKSIKDKTYELDKNNK